MKKSSIQRPYLGQKKLYTSDCGQLGLDDYNNRDVPTYVLTDPNIVQINNSFLWSPQHHRYFPSKFKQAVNLLYLHLKHDQNQIKIPKFVIHEIIKFLD
jgi:hypothetical protein